MRAVLHRARARIPSAQLPRLVMNDPGHGAYVAAYDERSLALLGELFTADLTDADTDAVCRELCAAHDQAQE